MSFCLNSDNFYNESDIRSVFGYEKYVSIAFIISSNYSIQFEE